MLDQNFVLPKTVDQDRESGVFYSYDYNNAHFIVLNTNNLSDSKHSATISSHGSRRMLRQATLSGR